MKDIFLALVGFGNVAQGLAQILAQDGERYAREYGLNFLISSIADPIKGNLFAPQGVPPSELLEAVQRPSDGGQKALESLPYDHPNWDALEMIQVSPAQVVIELSFTNLTTGEPATTYIREALRRKKHVITTNKGPIALHYDELLELGRLNEVKIGVEGTVMSGTPALRLGSNCLLPAGIRQVQGILNGTTNYILTQMESGQSYETALAEAQAQGYAEADPTGDVEGYDAAAKVAILSRLLLGVPLTLEQIDRQGISQLTVEDVAHAKAENKHWKLIGSLESTADGVRASVKPECLSDDHPLARVNGVTNAILYKTQFLGDITLIGAGAGRLQTGMAVIQDLLEIFSDPAL